MGDHGGVPFLADLDPVYRQLLDEPVTAVVAVIGSTGRANLTPVWLDCRGDTCCPPGDAPRLERVWTRYTGNEGPYGLSDPGRDERRVLFELSVDSIATFGRP